MILSKAQRDAELRDEQQRARKEFPRHLDRQIKTAHARYLEERVQVAAEANEYGYVGSLK